MSKLKKYKMFINGEWVDSENKKTFKSLNPENNEPWAEAPEASEKDVDKAVKSAQKALAMQTPSAQRAVGRPGAIPIPGLPCVPSTLRNASHQPVRSINQNL